MTDHHVSSAGQDDRYGIVPDPAIEPTISVPRAALIAGVSRRTGYLAAERGEWPVLRVGRAVRVKSAAFLQQYGLGKAA